MSSSAGGAGGADADAGQADGAAGGEQNDDEEARSRSLHLVRHDSFVASTFYSTSSSQAFVNSLCHMHHTHI